LYLAAAVENNGKRFRQKSIVDGRLKGDIDRRRSIEQEKGRRKKEQKKREEKEYLSLTRGPRPCAVAAHGSPVPVHRRCRGSRALFLPCREKDRGDPPYTEYVSTRCVLGSPNEDSWAEGLQLADFMKHQFPQVIWVPDKFIMPSEVCYSGRF
ncbi:hypothetical protein GW17_00034294, partial [Ensete ventricosum]